MQHCKYLLKSVSDFSRLQSRRVRGWSWHSRALSCRILVSNLGAAVGFCNVSTIKARSGGAKAQRGTGQTALSSLQGTFHSLTHFLPSAGHHQCAAPVLGQEVEEIIG